jgi:hypothetical protein
MSHITRHTSRVTRHTSLFFGSALPVAYNAYPQREWTHFATAVLQVWRVTCTIMRRMAVMMRGVRLSRDLTSACPRPRTRRRLLSLPD